MNDIRPIDANALIDKFEERYINCDKGRSYLGMSISRDDGMRLMEIENGISLVENAPTLDVAPVAHGHWIDVDYVYFGAKRFICDQCKDDEYWTKRFVTYKENFCPNCGAKMDEKENALCE